MTDDELTRLRALCSMRARGVYDASEELAAAESLPALLDEVSVLRARESILRTVVRDLMTTGGECARWMVHVSESGESYIEHADECEVDECASITDGPDTCDCGSDLTREAFDGACRTARAALAAQETKR